MNQQKHQKQQVLTRWVEASHGPSPRQSFLLAGDDLCLAETQMNFGGEWKVFVLSEDAPRPGTFDSRASAEALLVNDHEALLNLAL